MFFPLSPEIPSSLEGVSTTGPQPQIPTLNLALGPKPHIGTHTLFVPFGAPDGCCPHICIVKHQIRPFDLSIFKHLNLLSYIYRISKCLIVTKRTGREEINEVHRSHMLIRASVQECKEKRGVWVAERDEQKMQGRDEKQRIASEHLIGWVDGGVEGRCWVLRKDLPSKPH